MPNGKNFLLLLSGCLFAILLGLGFFLSLHKPLWNDEIFTQVTCIEQTSYLKIFGGCPGEGNNFPLFYIIQKMSNGLAHYHFPYVWDGEWNIFDLRSQIILRIPSNILMAASLSIIFFYFGWNYSIGWGIYSVLVSCSSLLVWMYWVEARPYSLWFFLTTLQTLLFLELIRQEKPGLFPWTWLHAVHFALSVTVFFSVIQVGIVSLLLWMFKERNWKKYILLFLIPVLVSCFFYLKAPKFKFFFSEPAIHLLLAGFSVEKACIVLLALIVLTFKRFWQNETKWFAVFTGLMIAMAGMIVLILKAGDTMGKAGFAISNRYFIFLTPVGIISVVLFSKKMMDAYRENGWMRINLTICLIGLTMIGLLETFLKLTAYGVY